MSSRFALSQTEPSFWVLVKFFLELRISFHVLVSFFSLPDDASDAYAAFSAGAGGGGAL